MEINEIVNQCIGALGYFLLAISYFSKEKSKLLIVQIVSNVFLATHFYLLSGIAGAICDIVCIITDIIIFLNDKRKFINKKLLVVVLIVLLFSIYFSTLYFTNSTFTLKELFPITATCMIVVSLVSDNKNLIRLIGLLAALCWLVYGIVKHSYASSVFKIIIILSTIISYSREKKALKKA